MLPGFGWHLFILQQSLQQGAGQEFNHQGKAKRLMVQWKRIAIERLGEVLLGALISEGNQWDGFLERIGARKCNF